MVCNSMGAGLVVILEMLDICSRMYQVLANSYKGIYPFKIGTTSFIYPDSYVSNVKMLAPCFDEIELLLLESNQKDSLPSKHVIAELAALSNEFGVSYNIHLPTDISLCDQDPSVRHKAVETIRRIIDLTFPLSPSTNTLHLSYNEGSNQKASVRKWQENVYKSIEQLLGAGIQGKILSIENLVYPYEWVEDVIADFNLSVCIDIGHLIMQGFDSKAFFSKYSQLTSIIHLHGVKDGKDHLSLDMLSGKETDNVVEILKGFTGVVSLEVFSFKALSASLKFLEQCWQSSASLIPL